MSARRRFPWLLWTLNTRHATCLGAIVLLCAASAAGAGEQRAVYRASGSDARLFDQYDNDGYSLEVRNEADGSRTLSVRVSDGALDSAAPFPPSRRDRPALVAAPDRDAFAGRLASGSRTEQEAVRRILLGVAREIRYDADRLRLQDPAAVFASRKAYCVGFAELAVDLLLRVGISARTVQGVLRAEPGSDRYEADLGGVYHRWIEVHYPDRGGVFSDPMRSINGVDAGYLPFGRRALARPRDLRLQALSLQGALGYESIPAAGTTIRVRPAH